VGFFHNVPHHPINVPKYNKKFGLDKILHHTHWREKMSSCLGIFTVSKYLKSFLDQHLNIPISALKHPTEFPETGFSYESFLENNNKMILMTGHWMRRFESLYFLNTYGKYKKVILTCWQNQEVGFIQRKIGEFCMRGDEPKVVGGVTRKPYVNNEEYDRLHQNNIVFLDLYDVAACNTVIDCLARNTPLLIRRLAGAIEYLGEDYPFYYEDISEATEKIQNFDLIYQTHNYLKQMDKTDLTLNYFINQMIQSEVFGLL
jgi:hypothetical protein